MVELLNAMVVVPFIPQAVEVDISVPPPTAVDVGLLILNKSTVVVAAAYSEHTILYIVAGKSKPTSLYAYGTVVVASKSGIMTDPVAFVVIAVVPAPETAPESVSV